MEKTFKNKTVNTPSLQVGQVWVDENLNKKFVICSIRGGVCFCENENGGKFGIGIGWFDEYILLGFIDN